MIAERQAKKPISILLQSVFVNIKNIVIAVVKIILIMRSNQY